MKEGSALVVLFVMFMAGTSFPAQADSSVWIDSQGNAHPCTFDQFAVDTNGDGIRDACVTKSNPATEQVAPGTNLPTPAKPPLAGQIKRSLGTTVTTQCLPGYILRKTKTGKSVCVKKPVSP